MATYVLLLSGMTVVVLIARVLKRRMNPRYLRSATLHSFARLAAVTVVVYGFVALLRPSLLVFAYIQIAAAVILCLSTLRTIRRMTVTPSQGKLADKDLPTVTVAIPARNETKDLEDCLRTIVASDYPKLEIIVLDDCSQLPTADVIKSFAQDGVRFIPGKPPAKRWLAKNQAYQALYEHASGDVIVFCGVDVRLGVSAVREIVYQLLERNKRMIGVLPLRRHASLEDSYIQPMRYWWEIALPRRVFNRPAMLSTCWAIYREDIHGLGSFKAVSRSVMPEQYFARELVAHDGYSFLRSSANLDVTTAKSLTEQRRTALRLRYPQLRKRPEWVYALLLGYGFFLIWPLLGWPVLYLTDGPWKTTLISVLFLVLTHVQILRISDPANTLFAAVTLPVAVITDFVLVVYSMLKYEFFSVFWKERNICLPVMHVYPSLPRLPGGNTDQPNTRSDSREKRSRKHRSTA